MNGFYDSTSINNGLITASLGGLGTAPSFKEELIIINMTTLTELFWQDLINQVWQESKVQLVSWTVASTLSSPHLQASGDKMHPSNLDMAKGLIFIYRTSLSCLCLYYLVWIKYGPVQPRNVLLGDNEQMQLSWKNSIVSLPLLPQ